MTHVKCKACCCDKENDKDTAQKEGTGDSDSTYCSPGKYTSDWSRSCKYKRINAHNPSSVLIR